MLGLAQDPSAAKPTEHVLGTISTIDPTARTITVKDDKTSSEQVVLLADTKTLIKVAPGAKDLKGATRITADQLAVGDRVDVRGSKVPDEATKIAARSVVLMSARDLAQAHAAEAAEWQHSIPGVVSEIDAASGKITVTTRTAEGPKPLIITTTPKSEYTRYSPDHPSQPIPSEVSAIQAGDQVRIIGDKSDDGTTVVARRIFSGAFKTLNGTILSIGSDGKSLTIKDLASKKPLEILIGESTTIRKLPPEVALRLAQRNNPGMRPAGTGAGSRVGSGDPSNRPSPPATDHSAPAPSDGSSPRAPGSAGFAPRGPRNGDISQMIERLPKSPLAELKPGDALIISGVTSGVEKDRLTATNIIAGVEPILQSAPSRQGGQATGGDWGLGEMNAPQ